MATMEPGFELYLEKIPPYRRLTPTEERALVMSARKGDLRARETLVCQCLRLVLSVSRRFLGRGLPLMDLVQEGNQGLLLAVDRFDPDRGIRFSTYAVWWIRQAVLRGLGNDRRLIRIPLLVNDRAVRLLKTARLLEIRLGSPPSHDQLADALGWSVDTIREMLRWTQSPLSLDAAARPGSDTTLGEMIPENREDPILDQIQATRKLAALEVRLSDLSPREAGILRRRFGLHGTLPETLEQIGNSIGVTKERVRQIEKKALRKLSETCQDLLEDA